MQRLFLVLFFIGSGKALFSEELILNINTSPYQIRTLSNGVSEIEIPDYSLLGRPGKPNLPCRILFIALPPGAEVNSVEVIGERREIGSYRIEPALPILPMMNRPEIIEKRIREFERIKEEAYASNELYPELLGELISEGSLRKYRFAVIALYPFAYRAKSQRLYYAKEILLKISYTQNLELIDSSLLSDISADKEASELFYNWNQARKWYSSKNPKEAEGYLIITTSSLVSVVDILKDWKTQLGYDVEVVTKEWIDKNISGLDLPQKIRNYLRSRLSDIAYVLIVGSDNLIPMRRCCPWTNDPDGPYDWDLMSPIPTDFYYTDLSSPDSLSWDRDGDTLYGERGDDRPDFVADVGLGRIPFDDPATISHIFEKIKSFEKDRNFAYKKSSLLAASIIYYKNENGWGLPEIDGATLMEKLIEDNIVESTYATTLYEKEGLAPSKYDCDYPDSRENILSHFKGKGLFIEFHHGLAETFYRHIWAEDDGDSVPEYTEISSPPALESSDASKLDDNYPAIVFLGSCLNGYPENINNLGASLLDRGSVGTISSSRITYGIFGWDNPRDGGIQSYTYYFFESLLKDTSTTQGIVGLALNRGRDLYMKQGLGYRIGPTGYATAYDFNLYGDPSLYHFGHPSFPGITERSITSPISLSLSSNPSSKEIRVSYHLPTKKRLRVKIWDKTGRLVKTLLDRREEEGHHTILWKGDNDRGEEVPSGVYFLEFDAQEDSITRKIILLK